jgi:predicted O-linked N-acetylglucosamine transferase (SPINDLY family)
MGILGRLTGRPGKTAAARESREEADARIARGQQLEDALDFAGAEQCFREALALAPSYPRAHLNLGNALHKQLRLEEALAAHTAALAFDAAYAPAHYNAGAVLVEQGRWADARRHLERALELKPDLADAAVHLATVCEGEGDLEGACRQLERALAIQPQLSGAWNNLGALLAQRQKTEEAGRAFEAALQLDPRSAPALAGLAQLDVNRGRSRHAAARFRQALDILPRETQLWGPYLFSLNLRDDVDAQAVAREHFAFGELLQGEVGAPNALPARAERRPIRVGYVSGDLLAHPVAWFLIPVLEHHDAAHFETYCYSNGHVDDMTARVRAAADHWRPIARRSDEQVAQLIRADGIDVLVDLSGHTPRNRLAVFARRAAPVQATWLGYLNTTGLPTMDFRITDGFTDPEGASEALHTEKIARLPHSQWAYVPHNAVPLKAQTTPGRPVTFGSFNQMAKVSDACLDLWCDILRRVPEARLRVHAVPDAVAAADLLARLSERGVNAARVETRGRVPTAEYLASIADVDIALDSMPYNGGTTTLDTYYMGVPLVALAGPRGIARGSYSIARTAGLHELVAQTPAEYVERNVALATDGAARNALRATLRARLEASPLMDPQRFTRDLEALYRAMLAAA